MNARAARQLADEANEIDITAAKALIKDAAKKGEYRLSLNLSKMGLNFKQVQNLIINLKSLDYVVKHDTGYDPRGESSWNNLVVSWDNA